MKNVSNWIALPLLFVMSIDCIVRSYNGISYSSSSWFRTDAGTLSRTTSEITTETTDGTTKDFIHQWKEQFMTKTSGHYLVFSVPSDVDGSGSSNASSVVLEEDNESFPPDCKARLDALESFYDERRRQRQVHVAAARKKSQNVYDSTLKKIRGFAAIKSYFDMWEPDAVCITEERSGGNKRFDALSDGPKFVCGVDYLRELSTRKQQEQKAPPCLVYSIGSNNDVAFEKAIKHDIGCEIHTFDPTLTKAFVGDAYATFHPWGLGADGAAITFGPKTGKTSSFTAYSFDHILQELGHTERKIDILKIDCEGCEYETMPPVFEAISAGKLKIDQILIEMHRVGNDEKPNFEPPTRFFELADMAGFRITHKERNHWGCAGMRCVEYALVSNDFLRRATASVMC